MSVAARRAVVRWAWRLFRREWRQQILVLTLLTVAVAAAVGLAAAAYNIAPVAGEAEFGTANSFFRFDEPEPDTLQTKLDAGEEWFGAIDVIGHRSVSIPGSIDTVDYRTQDPQGSFGTPMLDLRDGRFPLAADEIAVTDGVAKTFGLHIGAAFSLDGVDRTVVGLVENPSRLDDEFALLHPSLVASSDSVLMFVDASQDRVLSFRPPGDTGRNISSRGDLAEDVFAAVSVLVVSAVALFLVSLVAAASFVVVAQRRLRQLGMLAAIGATERHLRLVMVASGAVIGAVAATLGAILGVAGWVAVVPRVEHAAGNRIDGFNVPWWLVVTAMALAVLAATGAAWWPARTMARIPTVLALSGRPPRPTSAHRSASVAGCFVVFGVACLAFAGGVADETSVDWTNALLILAGTVAVVLGVLLFSPLAIRALAACASRFPIAPRLALRDLGRYQARSGAALAAISLCLGIPVTIVVTAAAAEHTAAAGNLSDRQLLVRVADIDGPFVPEEADVAALQAGVDRIVGSLDDSNLQALDAAIDPAAPPTAEFEGRIAVSLAQRSGDGWSDVSLLYVATPELLERSGLDLDRIESEDVEILTVETADLAILGVERSSDRSGPEMVENPRILPASYSSLPTSFITPDGLRQRGWEVVPSGRWLVETSRPLTGEQLAAARDVAAGAGLTIESRDQQEGLATLRAGATAVGMLLALGVLAMTVGLIRSEAAADVRTLTATGATGGTRRMLTATTSGALALLGVVLGTAGAYVALMAGHVRDLGELTPIPVVHLAAIIVGTPAAAAGAGWLLAGREPSALARQPIA
jgi:putative ABC transport system permease protein